MDKFNKDEINNESNSSNPFDQEPNDSFNEQFFDDNEEPEIFSLAEDRLASDNLEVEKEKPTTRPIKISKKNTNRLVVLLVTVGTLFMMWYTTFAQSLAFNARPMLQSGDGSWDIRFIDMYQKSKFGKVEEIIAPTYTSTVAKFSLVMYEPGDEITYSFTIKNCGNLDAKVSSIVISPENKDDDVILYNVDGINVGDELKIGEKTNITVTAQYNNNSTGSKEMVTKNVKIIINYKQK